MLDNLIYAHDNVILMTNNNSNVIKKKIKKWITLIGILITLNYISTCTGAFLLNNFIA